MILEHIQEEQDKRVILAGVWETAGREYAGQEDFDHSMDELEELTKACYMQPVGRVTQQLDRPSSATYMGAGKVDEIKGYAAALEAEQVIFNDSLTPSQIRNLQEILKMPVMDRTSLILDIFQRRARSRESRLQVELARLQYLKPRLIGMWETQNRQGGASGSMSSKGEGETQLEIDRRTIDARLARLRSELKVVERERMTQRKKRGSMRIPLVAMVGYTNAGKSTIMNAFVERYAGRDAEDRKVFEADMLFATLDTTVRRIETGANRDFLLSDTVGFIRRLPTSLVEAFKSTLEEMKEADLLLHVVDCSDPHARDMMDTTRDTITELGAGHIPVITVYNKADKCEPQVRYPRRGAQERTASNELSDSIYISAKDATSLDMLRDMILEKVYADYEEEQLLVPYDRGGLIAYLTQNTQVLAMEYTADGTLVTVRAHRAVLDGFQKKLRGS